jgi:hypothetical protein
LRKCEGLTAEQLTRRSVPPSNLSLLRLVRHLADVERGWFRRGIGEEDGGPVTVRWVLQHMLEEYARHNGHADLLREAIDGATGE